MLFLMAKIFSNMANPEDIYEDAFVDYGFGY